MGQNDGAVLAPVRPRLRWSRNSRIMKWGTVSGFLETARPDLHWIRRDED